MKENSNASFKTIALLCCIGVSCSFCKDRLSLSIGYVLKDKKEQKCLSYSSHLNWTLNPEENTNCIKPEIKHTSFILGFDYKLYKLKYLNLEYGSNFFIGKTSYSNFFFSIVDSSISILRNENWEYMGEFIIRLKPFYQFFANNSIFFIADIGFYTIFYSDKNQTPHERIIRLYPYFGFGIGYKYKKMYLNIRQTLFERTSINIGWYII